MKHKILKSEEKVGPTNFSQIKEEFNRILTIAAEV